MSGRYASYWNAFLLLKNFWDIFFFKKNLTNQHVCFQIKAVDNGRPQLKETCRVLFTVVERPLQSPSRPRFADGARRVTVMESDQVGHMVALVTADDADGDKIWYSIMGTYSYPNRNRIASF